MMACILVCSPDEWTYVPTVAHDLGATQGNGRDRGCPGSSPRASGGQHESHAVTSATKGFTNANSSGSAQRRKLRCSSPVCEQRPAHLPAVGTCSTGTCREERFWR